MDPQLAKLMARRRRKADGEGESSPDGGQDENPTPAPPVSTPSTRFRARPSAVYTPKPKAAGPAPSSPFSGGKPRADPGAPEEVADAVPVTPSKPAAGDRRESLYSPSIFETESGDEAGDGGASGSRRSSSEKKRQQRCSEEDLSELDALVSALDASVRDAEQETSGSKGGARPVSSSFVEEDMEESSPFAAEESEKSWSPTKLPQDTPLPPPPFSGDADPEPSRHKSARGAVGGSRSPRNRGKTRGDGEGSRSRNRERLSPKASGSGKADTLRRSPVPDYPEALEEELLAATSAAADAIGGRSPSKQSPPKRYRRSGSDASSSNASSNGGNDDHEAADSISASVEEPDPASSQRHGSIGKQSDRHRPNSSGRKKSRSPKSSGSKKSRSPKSSDRKGGFAGAQSLRNLFDSDHFEKNHKGGNSDPNSNASIGSGFGSFAADFGSFPDPRSESTKTDPSTKSSDGFNDPFGISASEEEQPAEYEPPSFGINLTDMDFGSGGGWGQPPPAPYDTSPIEKPPVNREESVSTQIKWMDSRPNMIVSSSEKNKSPAPVTNPLTGNPIVCRPSVAANNSHDILEWDPQRKTQVLATAVFSDELKRKIADKYRVVPDAVQRVWTISAGVHRSSPKQKGGQTEAVRVAALLDLTILGERFDEVLRVIAVWNWGGSNASVLVQLQSVLSPPSGADFTYDTKNLVVADGCIFVAGASAKGPCVFLNKPTVRETWSANFIVKNKDIQISHMAATNSPRSPRDPDAGDTENDNSGDGERVPYLAIALDDGSLSVWTYEAATKLNGKNNEAVRKLLFPMCRLHAAKVLQTCPVTNWSSREQTTVDGDRGSNADVGCCTHLEWIPYRASSHKQLLLLAASFQRALCLYHVALPKLQDKSNSSKRGTYNEIRPPSEKTILSQTISLRPFCFSKWPKSYNKSSCSFVDLGPHVPPSLVVLLNGSESNPDCARLALVTCPLPAYMGSTRGKKSGDHLAFHVWDTQEWTKQVANLPKGLMTSSLSSTMGILYYTNTSIEEIEYRTNARFPFGSGGVGTIPAGLTTSGSNYWADSLVSSAVGVLSIYTTFHCERFKSTLSPDPSSPTLLEWTTPTRRHWLVETFMGDSKGSKQGGAKPRLGREEKDSDDVVLGGAQSTVICELVTQPKIERLYPYRLTRNPYATEGRSPDTSQHIAVWFRPLHGSGQAASIGLVAKDGEGQYKLVQLLDSRDVVFLPNATRDDKSGSGIPQALVVSRNGGSVSLWQWKDRAGALGKPWQIVSDAPCRPILGDKKGNSTSEDDFVELRQFVPTRFQNKVSLLAIASDSSGRFCVVAGKLVAEKGLDWVSLLPNMKENPVLWLDEREQVSLVVPLPSEDSIQGGIGIATTRRVLILSSDLNVMATWDCELPPGSLVPLGSFTVAFSSQMDHKIRYLSGLPESFGRSGLIASFPIFIPSYYTNWLAGIRPDRFVYSSHHNGTRLVERGKSTNTFLLPLATTRPALLLEPMIANAIATGAKGTTTQTFLRAVLEKFGRKVVTMSHGEEEGIGNFGAGITPRVFELLEYYNFKSAASWLLTGTIGFDRAANSRLLPSYLPITAKIKAAFDADTHLHLIASGDQYFTEYVKSPDINMPSTLPRPSDPTAILCQQFALDAMKQGNFLDAIKMLDISGTQPSDAIMLQLSMALQLDPAMEGSPLIDSLYQQDSQTEKVPSLVASLAALTTELKAGKTPSPQFNYKWLQSLAPSVQRSKKYERQRSRLIGESSLSMVMPRDKVQNEVFSSEIPESKLVWNEGPNHEKENLLLLDNVQEWFGRRRPVILGREGAKSAEERGASTLAGILHCNDEDSFGGENEDTFKDGWVDGVGEGLNDEDKLSAYYRFSEGEEEDTSWRDEGIADITKFENTATIVGNPDDFNLQESLSSVDEGESGKVKPIHDLVFGQSGVGQASALVISAMRGGSLDLGLMHGPDHVSRQKCTIEFWAWIPESIEKEIILVRRSCGSSAGDFDVICQSEKRNLLWELGLHKNGELEFRTIAGQSVTTKPENRDNIEDTPSNTVHFSRWNHICIIMKQESMISSAVSLLIRGSRKIDSEVLNFSPPDFEVDDFSGASAFDQMLETSHLVFGIDHTKDFRLTELRVWALDRKDDDIKTWMTEYLECAEIKRKIKIKIKRKLGGDKGIALSPKKGLLTPPRGLKPPSDVPKGGLLAPPGGFQPPTDSKNRSDNKKAGLLAPPKQSKEDGYSSPKNATKLDTDFGSSSFSGANFGNFKQSPDKGADLSSPASFASDFAGRMSGSTFGSELQGEKLLNENPDSPLKNKGISAVTEETIQEDASEEVDISPLWESAIPLSEQVRTSAASALIRGPPATRHFGGNRGGLPDYRELERFGVGAISICGSEKTIVWRDDQVPPGLTYPIGASGAIVSDQMDGDGSEFLCCFMAKDKRMVVFELSTRTIVVELQMTTKLNYWRFLPPEAGEDTLCFMLITPVGGFHWMPLDESPRPRQVWKRGPELQGKKIVSYEEGGANGYDGLDMLSKVGMLLVTNSADATNSGSLEAWLVPICGDSKVVCASYEILGACLCQPPGLNFEAFMPLVLFVVEENNELIVCVSAVTQEDENSIGLTDVMTDALIEQGPYHSFDFEPPALAMGTYPEVLCCSLGTTVVVIIRRKGLVVAYELGESGLELIAQENVGHYVVDAVMRYNASEGGAEIVLLMSDTENRRDGRVGTFCFRTAC
ncbi:unnamed protein product [Pseudo-nitzschia multistriata]|uniref:Uncharacterized protein n=1 Tax=Pseudo-nitzschia multistriata TaxID=183589 RepID=A0A448ZQ92_9STRA|nr:unnamed protein product [Pseudo-nitzschia multistriata]